WVQEALPFIGGVISVLVGFASQWFVAARARKHELEKARLDDLRKLRDSRLEQLHELYYTVAHTGYFLIQATTASYPYVFANETKDEAEQRRSGAKDADRKLGEVSDEFA